MHLVELRTLERRVFVGATHIAEEHLVTIEESANVTLPFPGRCCWHLSDDRNKVWTPLHLTVHARMVLPHIHHPIWTPGAYPRLIGNDFFFRGFAALGTK